MHHLASALAVALAFIPGLHVLAQQDEPVKLLTSDQPFANASFPLQDTACSRLTDYGFTTLGSLPSFPYVGGFYTVTRDDSSLCGVCYKVVRGDKTSYILAVDVPAEWSGMTASTAVGDYFRYPEEDTSVSVTIFAMDSYACGLSV